MSSSGIQAKDLAKKNIASISRRFDKKEISMEPFPEGNWNENMLPQVLNMEKTTMEKHQGGNLQQSIKGKIVDYLWYLEKNRAIDKKEM